MHATNPPAQRSRFSPPARLGPAFALACALALGAAPARSGPPPWADAPYSYYADNAPIAEVPRNFAGSFSLSLELSPLVEGKVNGRLNSQNPTEFRRNIAASTYAENGKTMRPRWLQLMHNSPWQLTPELSRAAKRRRLQ